MARHTSYCRTRKLVNALIGLCSRDGDADTVVDLEDVLACLDRMHEELKRLREQKGGTPDG